MDKVEQGKAAKNRTIAEIRSAKKPVTKIVHIQLDGEVALRLTELSEELEEAKRYDVLSNAPDTAPSIQAQIDEVRDASKDTVASFTFRSIGRYRYDELVGLPKHQPTKDQKQKDGLSFNPDTFPPALVAESCVEPEMSLEDAQEIFSDPDWNGAELQRLFFGALEVNNETGDIPFSKSGSDQTLISALNSIMQSNTEFPTPST